MSFKFSLKPKEIPWKVEGKAPDPAKPGHFKPFWFPATFVMMSQNEYQRLREECGDDDVKLVRAIMTSWGLKDENDQVYDFANDEIVRAVINYQHISLAILTSFTNFISGGALAKN
jgi:hypothetical protein